MSEVARFAGVSLSAVWRHAHRHLTATMREAATENAIASAAELLGHATSRARRLHTLFEKNPEEKPRMASMALEHEVALLKARGDWKETSAIQLSGHIELSAADKADSDFQRYMRERGAERFPELQADFDQWAESGIMREVAETKKEAPPEAPPVRMLTVDDSELT